MPERKSCECDLLHRGLPRPGLNHQNGSENPSIIVRFTIRYRHRLCLDRHGRRSRAGRADLPDPDLTYSAPLAFASTLSMSGPDKVHASATFCPPPRSSGTIAKSRQAPMRRTFRISQPGLCESCIRRIAASACHKTGALSRPLIRQSSAKTEPHAPV